MIVAELSTPSKHPERISKAIPKLFFLPILPLFIYVKNKLFYKEINFILYNFFFKKYSLIL